LNFYSYVYNPLKFIDPLGFAKIPVKAGEGGRFGDLQSRGVVGDGLTPHHIS